MNYIIKDFWNNINQIRFDLISNFRRVLNVLCLFLGNSPGSEFYMPTFRNTLSVPSSYLPAYEDGTVFRNVGIYNSEAGELPRKRT